MPSRPLRARRQGGGQDDRSARHDRLTYRSHQACSQAGTRAGCLPTSHVRDG